MPFTPSRTKYRKAHRGSRSGTETRGTSVDFGEYGLQVLERGWIKAQQIEACRVTINRTLKRKGKVWIRIFAHKPYTKRPPETRMGKGKGGVEGYVAVVRPGRVLFELGGAPESLAKDAFRLASAKLGLKCRFVARATNH